MLYSMTGYGSATVSNALGTLSADVKTVNNRFLDVHVRLPREFEKFSIPLRKIAEKIVRRGKVDIAIGWKRGEKAMPEITCQYDQAKKYYTLFAEMKRKLGIEGAISLDDIKNMHGVIEVQRPEIDEKLMRQELDNVVSKALKKVVASRKIEGAEIKKDLVARKKEILTLWKNMSACGREVKARVEKRFDERIEDLRKKRDVDIDALNDRLAVEVMLFVDKADISEELARLKAHIDAIGKILTSKNDAPAGKQLDFLCQELLRETNTIGSKARDTQCAKYVLDMKNEIERIREQVQNVE